MKYRKYGTVWVAGALLFQAIGIQAADWPAWRGPDRDGISRETAWDPARLAAGARVLWQTNVGRGYSAVSIADGRLYTMGHEGGMDAVLCLDAADGRELWRHEYAVGAGSYPGPRSTPVVEGDRVYTLSREGHAFALDRISGRVLWTRLLLNGTGAGNIRWGLASSAYIEGDTVYFNAGRLGVALDKHTGDIRWSSTGQGGYATPVIFRAGSHTQLALFSAKALYGVDPRTGRERWSHPWETSYDVHAADPIFHRGRLLVSSGYNTGAALLDLAAGRPEVVWQNRDLRKQFGTGVVIGEHVYAIDGNTGRRAGLVCIAWETGELRWREPFGFGALSAAGDKLIILLEGGDLVVAAADPRAYREVARAPGVLPRTCWTMPVLSHGRIYGRNHQGDLVCIDVGTP